MSCRASLNNSFNLNDNTSFTLTPEDLHKFVADADEGLEVVRANGGPVSVAKKLHTDLHSGLCDSEAAETVRRFIYGSNKLPDAEEVTFFQLLWESLNDTMMQLLMAAAAVSLLLGVTVPNKETGKVDLGTGWIEGAAILISVSIVTLVSSLNNYNKEQKFNELSAKVPVNNVSVIRRGHAVTIPETELLVGDLFSVYAGMVMPCDALLINSLGLKVDESGATGESDEVNKATDGDFILRSGSNILEGEGLAIVTGVGVNSFTGKIAMACRAETPKTPLQIKLSELADTIGYLGMTVAVLMIVILSLKELLNIFYFHSKPLNYKTFLDIITVAITIVVVAVPEGLPLSVTITLAYSMGQLFSENNLVRHLNACETMGSVTTICTDKTGTLTQNHMTVSKVFLAGKFFSLTGNVEHDTKTCALVLEGREELAELLCEAIAMNSSIRLHTAASGSNSFVTSNKTDEALLKLLHCLDRDPMSIRATYDVQHVRTFPFTSGKKSMTTCIRTENNELVYYVKGGAELIIGTCSHVLRFSGETCALSCDERVEILDHTTRMASSCLRAIAIAFARVAWDDAKGFPNDDSVLPENLCLVSIIGIEDPLRVDVAQSVAKCREAGVTVRMVTGDNIHTAVSVASQVGIFGTITSGPAKGEKGVVMFGKDFREMAHNTKKMNWILPRLQVLARASPLDKSVLVSALMARGEVVAVTGDGTNDAPALKSANVGFAMRSGTEVAQTASDVVIMDDNFTSIVTAMKWGRNIQRNICKFIQFQMTVNLAAVVIAFIGAVLSPTIESPLKPVQLLWLNLIMDTMAALALATEGPSEDILTAPPRGRSSTLITRRMWFNIFGQGLYQIIFQLWLLRRGHKIFGVKRDSPAHLSIVFNTFVLLQVSNEFNARILDSGFNVFRGLCRAPMFLLIVTVTLVVQYTGMFFGAQMFHVVSLTLRQHILCIFFSLAPLVLGEILRAIRVREPHQHALDYILRDENGNVVAGDDESEEIAALQLKKLSYMSATANLVSGIKKEVRTIIKGVSDDSLTSEKKEK